MHKLKIIFLFTIVFLSSRHTFNRQRKDFSTGLFIDPNSWDPKKQRLLDRSDQTTNLQLSLIENKISKAFLMLQVKDQPFTV